MHILFRNNRKLGYKPALYVSYGPRYLNIIHTKLRHNCILSYDLFRKNISGCPYCECGLQGDSYHFCSLYVPIIPLVEMNYLDDCYTLLNYILLIVTYSYVVMKHNDDTNHYIFFLCSNFNRDSGRFTKI